MNGPGISDQNTSMIVEALAKLANSVTPAKTGVQKRLRRLDSVFRRNDAKGLLQEVQL